MNTSDFFRKELPTLLILAAPFVVIPFLAGRLPDQIPMQWDLEGNVNWYGSKWLGLLLLPLLNIGIYLIFTVLPRFDPKKQLRSGQKPVPALRFFTLLTTMVVYFLYLGGVLGLAFDMPRMALLVVTLLFLILGNYLSSIQPNYFIGIRTPWTLEDPDIWRQTHRMGGRLWVAMGCLLVILWLLLDLHTYLQVFLTLVIGTSVFVLAYSYVLYARKQRASRPQA